MKESFKFHPLRNGYDLDLVRSTTSVVWVRFGIHKWGKVMKVGNIKIKTEYGVEDEVSGLRYLTMTHPT
uniref:Uncharacterized protein n=1 Tax=Anopheles minimus TaxID=112268 RepID=A0A182WNG5_9DIPT